MKKLIFSAVILSFVLTSCSKYQINMLSSTNTVKDEQTGNFDMVNDSVKISYSFYGVNAPVKIQVYNKMDKPLYVDWQRSAAIIGEKVISYATGEIPIKGNITTDSYKLDRTTSISYGDINAVATLPKDVSFIPPHAQISKTLFNITKGFINVADSNMKVVEMHYIDEEHNVKEIKVKSASFSKEASPLAFKSYLTVYIAESTGNKAINYQHEFYVSNLISTGTNPKNLEDFQAKRGDYFINTKKTGYAKVMTGAGIAAAVGAVAATSAMTTDNHK